MKTRRRTTKRQRADMGSRWATAREAAKLTQAQLAAKLKLTGSYISLIESGDRVPDISVIKDAAAALGVGLEALVP